MDRIYQSDLPNFTDTDLFDKIKERKREMMNHMFDIDYLFEELFARHISPTYTFPFGKHKGKTLEEVPESYLASLVLSGVLDKYENMELKEQVTRFFSTKGQDEDDTERD